MMALIIGATVYVKDDDGKKHEATITGITKLVGPFRTYEVVIEDSGQILNLMPESLTNA